MTPSKAITVRDITDITASLDIVGLCGAWMIEDGHSTLSRQTTLAVVRRLAIADKPELRDSYVLHIFLLSDENRRELQKPNAFFTFLMQQVPYVYYPFRADTDELAALRVYRLIETIGALDQIFKPLYALSLNVVGD